MDHFRGDKIRSRCIQMTSETKKLYCSEGKQPETSATYPRIHGTLTQSAGSTVMIQAARNLKRCMEGMK